MPFSVCAQPPIPRDPELTRRSRLLLLPAAQEAAELPGLGLLELGKASVLAKRRARTPGGYISQEERDERRARLFQHSEANHVAGLIGRADPFRPASLRRMGLRSPPKKRGGGGGERGPKQARRPPTPLEMLSGPSQR